MTAAATKPVKLQVNNSGAWKDVVRFDAADDVACSQAMDAAESLGRIDPLVKWRVCMADASQTVLMFWTAEKGWRSWKER